MVNGGTSCAELIVQTEVEIVRPFSDLKVRYFNETIAHKHLVVYKELKARGTFHTTTVVVSTHWYFSEILPTHRWRYYGTF